MTIKRQDVFTPANLLSMLGLLLVVYGSVTITSLSGVLTLGLGRVLDLLDGHIARRTRTSEFGAAVDAVFDKLALAIIITACLLYDVVPWPVLLWIVVQNGANAVLTSKTKLKGRKIVPTLDGKHTMFLQNISIGLFLLENHASTNVLQQLLATGGMLSAAASVPLGIRATLSYAKQLNASPSKPIKSEA